MAAGVYLSRAGSRKDIFKSRDTQHSVPAQVELCRCIENRGRSDTTDIEVAGWLLIGSILNIMLAARRRRTRVREPCIVGLYKQIRCDTSETGGVVSC